MANREKPPREEPSPEELWAEIVAFYDRIYKLCDYENGAFLNQLPENIKKLALIANEEGVDAENPKWKEEKNLSALKERLENLYAILFEHFERYTGQKPN